MTIHKLKAGQKIELQEIDADDTGKFRNKQEVHQLLARNIERMAELQHMLYAQGQHALLIVLQAMDAGGKDGTIRRIMSGVNPQGVQVTSFKVPTEEERSHDFLWRIHKAAPRRGMIGIFNRSHYEDVLVVRVHDLVPKKVWAARYDHINNFERLLAESGVTILKFYLHISREEQKERFQARLEQPHKRKSAFKPVSNSRTSAGSSTPVISTKEPYGMTTCRPLKRRSLDAALRLRPGILFPPIRNGTAIW
jgi:PPK2 family polyphosphate:nucleotide phosphotransferase